MRNVSDRARGVCDLRTAALALLGGTPKRWRDPVWSGGWWDPAKSVGYGTGIY